MSKTVILVPRRADHGRRDLLWDYTRSHWEASGYPIYEGDHLTGPFNRSYGVNVASKEAGDWDIAVVIDSDVILDPYNVKQAIELAQRTRRMVFPFRTYHSLNLKGSDLIMNGYKGNWMPYVRQSFRDNKSACFVIHRAAWDAIGGFDERFVGWGWEDVAFVHALHNAYGAYLRLSGDLWHLWHMTSAENNHTSPLYIANRDLCHRYYEARTKEETIALLSEPGGPLA